MIPNQNEETHLPSLGSYYNIMGSINNLPEDRQAEFNQRPKNGGLIIDYSPFGMARAPSNGADWWANLPTVNTNVRMPSKENPTRKKKSHKQSRREKPSVKQSSAAAVAKPQTPRRSAIERMSDSGVGAEAPPEIQEIMPLLNLDQKSPIIWTIGNLLIILIVFVCAVIQYGGFVAMSVNPLFGPDQSTLLLFGAKYGPSIIDGEYWRFITPIWLHSGVIHVVISVSLLLSCISVERDSGFWRALIVYILAGTYGFILSSVFIPEAVSCGSTGALLGYLGIMLSDVISSWRSLKRPACKFFSILLAIIVSIVIGLTPYLDNFLHLGGLIIGFLCALMLLPNLTFLKWEVVCHGFIAFLAFPLMSLIYMLTLVVFLREIDSGSVWCEWCYYLNCVNISGWCPSISSYEMGQNVYYLD